jgi:hypothetical protein
MKTRKYVEVFYDPDRCNWDAAIEQELKRRGLEHGQATVICRPFQRLKSGSAVKHYGKIAPAVADNQI